VLAAGDWLAPLFKHYRVLTFPTIERLYDADLMQTYVARGHLAMVDEMETVRQQRDWDRPEFLADYAGYGGRWELFRHLVLRHKYPWTCRAYIWASGNGHYGFLEMIQPLVPKWDSQALTMAIKHNQLDTAVWLHKQGCSVNQVDVRMHAWKLSKSVVDWLLTLPLNRLTLAELEARLAHLKPQTDPISFRNLMHTRFVFRRCPPSVSDAS